MVNKYDLETIENKVRELISKELTVDLSSEAGYIKVVLKLQGVQIHESKLRIE